MPTSIPAGTLEKFTTFGDLLRFLRRRTGLTQLELAVAVGYSDAQISRLEQNLRLPDLTTIEARFVSALGLAEEPKAVARLLDLAANVRREDAPALGLCPYKGLNYFDEADADLFVGREALAARLTERVLALASNRTPNEERFLAVVGASGSGKSSLVRAGLVPALRWNQTSADWRIHVMTPTAQPLDSLAASLTQDGGSVAATAALIDDLRRDPRSLPLFIQREMPPGKVSHRILVVDQFEELFALCRSEAERSRFIDNLLAAAARQGGPTIVVLTLRADFYAHCASYVQLREALARHQEYIGAMSDEELRRAIEEPARRGRWEFESGLVELLLHEVGHEPGALPLLSHALMETWQRRRGRMMTLSGYAASGGVRGAIAETAEAVFTDQFSREQQAIARRIFLRLTELGEETATGDTRRRATFDELIVKPDEAATTQAVLKALADARLITTHEDSAEVAHEALIREWPTLRGWLEDNRDSLRLHRHLTEAAREWSESSREPDVLYRGAKLTQLREWAAAHADEMNPQEREFMTASIELSEREVAEREAQRQRELEAAQKLAEEQKRRAEEQSRAAQQLRRRAMFLTGSFLLALIMAGAALFFAEQARQRAVEAQNASDLAGQQRAVALEAQATAEAEAIVRATAEADAEEEARISFSRELAAAALNNLEVDPELSVLLALQAVEQADTAEAESALHNTVSELHLLRTLSWDTDFIWDVAFYPDGTRLIASGGDARVWDIRTGQELLQIGPRPGWMRWIALSRDGKRLVADGGGVGEEWVWDAATGQRLSIISTHSSGKEFVRAISPDGTRFATIWINETTDFSHNDVTAKIWDMATGAKLFTLTGHLDVPLASGQGPGGVRDVEFSPDGKRVATAGSDGTARAWDLTSPDPSQSPLVLAGHVNQVNAVAFSPDGTRLATAGFDGTVKVWDVSDGARRGQLEIVLGHTNEVMDVAFTPDGTRLVTAATDGKARVWDAVAGRELLRLVGLTGGVTRVAVSPDGTLAATLGQDRTVRIWDITPGREMLTLIGPDKQMYGLAISPDGARAATGTFDTGTDIVVWDLKTNPGERLLKLKDAGYTSAFSPDGKRLATAGGRQGEGARLRIWDPFSGQLVMDIGQVHSNTIMEVAYSPDGKEIATASFDGSARVFDAATGKPLLFLTHSGFVYGVAFSPDSTRVATGSWDLTVKVWDVHSGKLLLTLPSDNHVFDISFSPDGKRLAVSDRTGAITLWDISSGKGEKLYTLTGHTSIVTRIDFSPDGTRLASGSGDGTVRVWDVSDRDGGRELLTLSAHTDTVSYLSYCPDGMCIGSAGYDGTTRFYYTHIEDLIASARSRVTRTLTADECRRYLHMDKCPAHSTP